MNLPKNVWITAIAAAFPFVAYSAPQDQCYKMHNRLTGVPPTPAALASCVALVTAGQLEEAALAITEHPLFYGETLRYTFSPWTNENDAHLVPFDDLQASVLGYARDDLDFRQFLYGDITYTCGNSQNQLPEVALNNNDHYQQCGESAAAIKDSLQQANQVDLNPALANNPGNVPAGVYTTRGFASAYYVAGTNRAAFRFTLAHFLCEEIDGFHDTTIADSQVRRDVTRAPGGKAETYLLECKGCHAGMDAMSDAWAYLNFDDEEAAMVYSKPAPGATPADLRGAVTPKYANNAGEFTAGHTTVNDTWMNLWNRGQNAKAGWNFPVNTILRGTGPKQLGQMFAETDQFARCIAKKAYKKTCLSDQDLANSPIIRELADGFKASGYKLKTVFAKSAAKCSE